MLSHSCYAQFLLSLSVTRKTSNSIFSEFGGLFTWFSAFLVGSSSSMNADGHKKINHPNNITWQWDLSGIFNTWKYANAVTFFPQLKLYFSLTTKTMSGMQTHAQKKIEISGLWSLSYVPYYFLLWSYHAQKTFRRNGPQRSNTSVPMFPSSWWETRKTCVTMSIHDESWPRWSRYFFFFWLKLPFQLLTVTFN